MIHQLTESYQKISCINQDSKKDFQVGPLLKTGLPLIKNVLKPLSKSVLIPLGLTAAAATDAVIQEPFLDQV